MITGQSEIFFCRFANIKTADRLVSCVNVDDTIYIKEVSDILTQDLYGAMKVCHFHEQNFQT